MKLQRVYLDTSVLGGCFDPEFAEWSNGLLQDFRNGVFKPLLSQVTATELQDAPEKVQTVYAELLALGAELVVASDNALELADAYQAHGILRPSSTMTVYTSRWPRSARPMCWSVGTSNTLCISIRFACSTR